MFEPSLVRAVKRFASLTQGVPDSDLDREWAWGAYDEEGVRFAFFRTYEELCELATRTATMRSTLGPETSTAQRILAQYHRAHRDLQAALLGAGEDAVGRAPAEGEWALHKVVAHIVGADLGFFVVVKYALDRWRTGDGRPAAIPDEAWDTISGVDEAAFEALVDGPFADLESYRGTLHNRVLRELADIRDEELAAPSMYWEGKEVSLRFRLHRFDSHLRQHTVQVDKTLETIGHAPNEARRLLRLIYGALADAEGATIGAWDAGQELRRATAETIAARTDEIAAILAE
jgi:uncharacterized damage-inducible protein DinB